MKQRIDPSLPNNHHVVAGQSGSGKSTWVKRKVRKARRLLVWDPHYEYPVTRHRSLAAFVAAARQSGPLQIALSVDPTPRNFEKFCEVAELVISADRKTTVVVEELADVTTPSKASPAWGRLARGARKFGGTIYAITQRPQEADKTIYTQAAYLWVGFLERPKDQKEMADRLAVSVDDVRAIKPGNYLYKGPGKAATSHKITFPKK
ncbi:MAG TPA: hypothetical protein VKA48_01575, partial [Gammaproteobacteria bacterium]|nr:hypothetical protein [Gammaproteobacteria bacterium]